MRARLGIEEIDAGLRGDDETACSPTAMAVTISGIHQLQLNYVLAGHIYAAVDHVEATLPELVPFNQIIRRQRCCVC